MKKRRIRRIKKIKKVSEEKIFIIPKKLKKLKKIKKIEKLGRWCEYYNGRLPFPIECQWNQETPLCIDRPNCKNCKRQVRFVSWKKGLWDKIKVAISNGEDLSDMEIPFKEEN